MNRNGSWENSVWGRGLLAMLGWLSYIYYAVIWLKTALYESGAVQPDAVPGCRLLCVGNITCGGTGKTPAVIHLAQTLRQQGLKVTVVSRGYKGRREGELTVVSDGEKILCSAADAGDEPHLIARRLPDVPVVTGKQRWAAAMYAWRRFAPQIIILDDGYQRLSLRRDVNLLLLDARKPFDAGYLIPRGLLREPVTAVSRAQIIMFTRVEPGLDLAPAIKKIRLHNPEAVLLKSVHQPQDLQNVRDMSTLSLNWLSGKRVFCFCGIAQPQSFKKTVELLGANIVQFMALPDHYAYNQAQIDQMFSEAENLKAQAILTTEKDAVRFSLPEESSLPCLALRIKLHVTSGENDWQAALNIIRG